MKTIKKNLIFAVVLAIPLIIASCKKSDPPAAALPTKPTISTNAITSITANTATGGGFIGDSGNVYRVTAKGVIYSSLGDPGFDPVSYSQTYDILNALRYFGSYTSSMTGLTPNTTYYVRAYVGWEPLGAGISNIIYGEKRSFKTAP
ncbi:MAG: hypothetical protein IPP81_14725 [Chitinophagaceae bacterium]|nr:hypothetical protein [Chitinophagaceae bacterium]